MSTNTKLSGRRNIDANRSRQRPPATTVTTIFASRARLSAGINITTSSAVATGPMRVSWDLPVTRTQGRSWRTWPVIVVALVGLRPSASAPDGLEYVSAASVAIAMGCQWRFRFDPCARRALTNDGRMVGRPALAVRGHSRPVD